MPKLVPTVAACVCFAFLLGACGSTPSRVSGLADVAYAGSLELVMQRDLGPAFTHHTGYQYEGRGAGALGLAQEIRAAEITPNVFLSVGSGPVALLEPKFTSWAVEFASSPLVLAYYPHGPHASELAQIASGKLPLTDLFQLLAEPGFRLGRTDPATDPQGQDFAMMFQLAERELGVPAATVSADLAGGSSQIYPETALEAQLQAGQLDAASAFRSQAQQLHLPYVPLPSALDFGDPAMAAAYARASLRLSTGALVHGFPLVLEATTVGDHDRAAALAFIQYLLSSPGRLILARDGYSAVPLKILGDSAAAPDQVRKLAG
ncbi:MAG: extracellular solute-binding protein [Candidatus Dormibacteraeota bacterium]|nr:extracellular solute-binding protein [Candidatus Dormibacteraeota bacterium]